MNRHKPRIPQASAVGVCQADAPYHPLRKIKEGKDEYETFRNHVKGIEGAMRRLSRNPYFIRNLGKPHLKTEYKNLEYAISVVRGEL